MVLSFVVPQKCLLSLGPQKTNRKHLSFDLKVNIIYFRKIFTFPFLNEFYYKKTAFTLSIDFVTRMVCVHVNVLK